MTIGYVILVTEIGSAGTELGLLYYRDVVRLCVVWQEPVK
jgi:hypothetical protein